MPPALPGMEQGNEEKGKVSKGAAIGTAVGVGVAAAVGGAAAGATVISDALGRKHYDLSDDDDDNIIDEPNGKDDNGYYDDDKDLDNRNDNDEVAPREERRRDDENFRDDENRRDINNPRRGYDNNGDDIDGRTDAIIERDQIDVDIPEGEWQPVGWRTVTDEDGNEVTGMLFEDGNGGYVVIIEGEPGSGIYDVAMNPNSGEMLPISDQLAYTRGDLEVMIDPDGGYMAPGDEDRMFAENPDIDKDIIITDNGDLTAQSDMPDDGGDTYYEDGGYYDGTPDEDVILDDQTDIITDDGIVMTDDIITDDGIAMTDDIITDDDSIIMDDDDFIIDDEQYAMVDEEVIVDDEELEQYLGDDEMAEVNDDPVEFVDDSQDLMADTAGYMPEDTYDDSMEMDADLYDDGGIDIV